MKSRKQTTLPTKVLSNRPVLSAQSEREAFFPLRKTMRIVTAAPVGASDDAMERKKHEPFFDRAYVPYRRGKRHKKNHIVVDDVKSTITKK